MWYVGVGSDFELGAIPIEMDLEGSKDLGLASMDRGSRRQH